VLVTNAGGTASAGDTLADVAQQWLDAYRLNVLTAVLITEALLPAPVRTALPRRPSTTG
jgi:3-oxoacyl-[acyl-carrier protein] reductase